LQQNYMAIHCLHNHKHNSTIKNNMCTLTSQYGSWNIILNRLMPFLCMGSNFLQAWFLRAWFLGPCSHSCHSMAHLIVSDANIRVGGTLFFCFPIECNSIASIKVVPKQLTVTPTIYYFFNFLEKRNYVARP
jgi:hypothetical protein